MCEIDCAHNQLDRTFSEKEKAIGWKQQVCPDCLQEVRICLDGKVIEGRGKFYQEGEEMIKISSEKLHRILHQSVVLIPGLPRDEANQND